MHTINSFNNLDKKLTSYGNYAQPWKLDNGSSGTYCGPGTYVCNQRCKQNSIKNIAADRDNMQQIEAGSISFNDVPQNVSDVQISPIMPNRLISAG